MISVSDLVDFAVTADIGGVRGADRYWTEERLPVEEACLREVLGRIPLDYWTDVISRLMAWAVAEKAEHARRCTAAFTRVQRRVPL